MPVRRGKGLVLNEFLPASLKEPLPVHLVVLIHGLLGTSQDFTSFKDKISAMLEEKCFIYCIQSNQYRTFDGLQFSANRAAEEILACLETCPSIKRISFIGHCVGGLVGRLIVHILDNIGLFSRCMACCFITLATPHLGLCQGSSYIHSYGFTRSNNPDIISIIAGVSGKQLFLLDHCIYTKPNSRIKNRHNSQPLLVLMTSPPFLESLAKFSLLATYANVQGDNKV
jgi:hypothetical protein